MTDENGRILSDREVDRRARLLTEQELRVLGLLCLGWTDHQVARAAHLAPGTIKTYVSHMRGKLDIPGSGRVRLALFYTRYLLPLDMLGNPPFCRPGDKLAAWVKRAEAIRGQLVAGHVLQSRHVAAARLLTDPAHADKTNEQLGELMGVTGATFGVYVTDMTGKMPHGSRLKVAVVATLAPFDAVALSAQPGDQQSPD